MGSQRVGHDWSTELNWRTSEFPISSSYTDWSKILRSTDFESTKILRSTNPWDLTWNFEFFFMVKKSCYLCVNDFPHSDSVIMWGYYFLL